MQILKSLLWSLTFPIAALIGQVVGYLLGEVLYFIYNNVMFLNIPQILNQIAPVIIGGLIGGYMAAEVINRYAHPVHLVALLVVPSLILAVASAGIVIGYLEDGVLIDSVGMLISNLAMITIFYRMVRNEISSQDL
jgi:hypothetical protein